MLHRMYSIRDAKGEIYHPPYFNKTHGEAERNFTSLCKDEKSMQHQYPEDFDLYFVGTYDDQNGTLDPLDTPQHIAKAIDVKNRQ